VGLHAIQALALLAFGISRWRRSDATRVRMVLAAAASYASLFVLLLWQALSGQSVIAPDGAQLALFAIWAALTLIALGWIAVRSRSTSSEE
jgi:hypothetical protein